MARLGHPVFEFIVDRLLVPDHATIVDLGCGEGPALHAVARRYPAAALIGVDNNADRLRRAATVLAPYGAQLAAADLDRGVPLRDSTVDAVLCHNTLECVADPVALLDEAARVLRPGGQAVLSHVDWESIVVNGADPELNRHVIDAYANQLQPWTGRADARMGRKLAGIVHHSALGVRDVTAHVTLGHTLGGDALARVDEIAHILRRGAAGLSPDDVISWRRQLDEAASEGTFYFAETAFVVLAVRD